ncbi:MAG: CDP-diacylglycerol--glycerol-3-phosphate 3-phosphatidyltransferase [Paracoccaceae bacterium]|nr:CDP-diacylglycerol--glycerol-3-phosphate 3-phosphatidyltransferase [Paracoccaceae bacterium]
MHWTLPNLLTVGRLVAAPTVAAVFLVLPRPLADWIALTVFVLSALTDFLDGYLARLWKQESRFGRMLDPIADKAMVVIALTVLTALTGLDMLVTVPAVVIMFREILVSGLREFMGDRSKTLGVTALARWKTTVQMVAIAVFFLATGLEQVPDVNFVAKPVGLVLLWLAAAITLVTGWDYLTRALEDSPGPNVQQSPRSEPRPREPGVDGGA